MGQKFFALVLEYSTFGARLNIKGHFGNYGIVKWHSKVLSKTKVGVYIMIVKSKMFLQYHFLLDCKKRIRVYVFVHISSSFYLPIHPLAHSNTYDIDDLLSFDKESKDFRDSSCKEFS